MTRAAPYMTTGTPWQVDIILADGFVLVELSGVVEVLRMANRINPVPLFEWRFLSRKGGYIASLSGLGAQTETISDRPDADYLL